MTASHDKLQSHAPAIAVEELVAANANQPYDAHWASVKNYWHRVGDPQAEWVSGHNQSDFQALEAQLEEPTGVKLGKRDIPADEIATEWYLRLGSLNNLQTADRNLTLGFIRLWEGAKGAPHKRIEAADLNDSFASTFIELAKLKEKPEAAAMLMKHIAASEDRASKAILAGNVILDYVRSVPYAERQERHLGFLRAAHRINAGLVQAYANKAQLSDTDKRLISDALKFKYELEFESLTTEWQLGRISEDDYQKHSNGILLRQLKETADLATDHKVTNGDLHEHYFTHLLRYGLAGWRDETRYVVQAATRRQDEPHDGFAPMNLDCTSFDAKITDLEGEVSDQYVQLKLPGALSRKYMRGIQVVDDIIESDNNYRNRLEIIAGMKQLMGLVAELYKEGYQYTGETSVAVKHIETLKARLTLPEAVAR